MYHPFYQRPKRVKRNFILKEILFYKHHMQKSLPSQHSFRIKMLCLQLCCYTSVWGQVLSTQGHTGPLCTNNNACLLRLTQQHILQQKTFSLERLGLCGNFLETPDPFLILYFLGKILHGPWPSGMRHSQGRVWGFPCTLIPPQFSHLQDCLFDWWLHCWPCLCSQCLSLIRCLIVNP